MQMVLENWEVMINVVNSVWNIYACLPWN